MTKGSGPNIVGNGTSGRNTAVDLFQGDGDRMGKGVHVKANEDGGVQEAIGGSKVDQRLNRDRRLAWDKEMHQESEMARGGEREGRGGKGKSATQPSSYCLGWEFFTDQR